MENNIVNILIVGAGQIAFINAQNMTVVKIVNVLTWLLGWGWSWGAWWILVERTLIGCCPSGKMRLKHIAVVCYTKI